MTGIPKVTVSRHPAAIQFVARHLGGTYNDGNATGLSPCIHVPDGKGGDHLVAVLASARPEDVRGRVVYGNLPLHLACLASEIVAIEFSNVPPRGQEYSLKEMDEAGAMLRRYKVTTVCPECGGSGEIEVHPDMIGMDADPTAEGHDRVAVACPHCRGTRR